MKHYWHELPPEAGGIHWFAGVDIYAEQVQRARDGAVFVELGCWKGRSTSFMGVEIHNSGKQVTFYAIDHWKGSDAETHDEDEDFQAGRIHEVFLRNIEPVKQHVRWIKQDSAESASLFVDGSVDFVYVDASHTFEAVAKDLDAWWPKLKPGGVIAGDDWQFTGVARAVTEFAQRMGVAHTQRAGNPRDWLQWQMVKP